MHKPRRNVWDAWRDRAWPVKRDTGDQVLAFSPVDRLVDAHHRQSPPVGVDPVFGALVLMFRPAANDYFRAARSARRLAPGRTMADRTERK